MIEVVKLEPWHVEVLHSNGFISEYVYSNFYTDALCKGIGYTLMVDGIIIACAGVIPCWNGVADGWGLITPQARKKPVALLKAFVSKFDEICAPFKRVQITVEEGFEEAERFAQFLGFTYEGRMEYYAPNGDTHLRYARLNHG